VVKLNWTLLSLAKLRPSQTRWEGQWTYAYEYFDCYQRDAVNGIAPINSLPCRQLLLRWRALHGTLKVRIQLHRPPSELHRRGASPSIWAQSLDSRKKMNTHRHAFLLYENFGVVYTQAGVAVSLSHSESRSSATPRSRPFTVAEMKWGTCCMP
jgi:hypothetical protein